MTARKKQRNPPALSVGAAQLLMIGVQPTDRLIVSHGKTFYPRQGRHAGKKRVIYTCFHECLYHWACRGLCNWMYPDSPAHKRWKAGEFDIELLQRMIEHQYTSQYGRVHVVEACDMRDVPGCYVCTGMKRWSDDKMRMYGDKWKWLSLPPRTTS